MPWSVRWRPSTAFPDRYMPRQRQGSDVFRPIMGDIVANAKAARKVDLQARHATESDISLRFADGLSLAVDGHA